MSLINDALKRAAQKPASLPSASDLSASCRPVEEHPHHFHIAVPLLVLVPIIGIGLWFLAKGLRMHEEPKPAPVVARAPEPAISAPVVVVEVTNPPASVAPAQAAPQPVYKLQGIYWRPSKPSAVVNGKIVHVGDRIKNASVTAIDQESVTLKVDGQPDLLILP
jgi:hypothetical protein